VHQYIDRIWRNQDVPVQNIMGSFGDLIVRRRFLVGTMHPDILRDGMYALDATGRGYDCELFRVAVDVPTESHDALINGDTNMLATEAWIKFKLIDDILPKLTGL
jgi:hypothetical protein